MEIILAVFGFVIIVILVAIYLTLADFQEGLLDHLLDLESERDYDGVSLSTNEMDSWQEIITNYEGGTNDTPSGRGHFG